MDLDSLASYILYAALDVIPFVGIPPGALSGRLSPTRGHGGFEDLPIGSLSPS